MFVCFIQETSHTIHIKIVVKKFFINQHAHAASLYFSNLV